MSLRETTTKDPREFTELDFAIEQLAIAEKRARDAERKLHRLEREMAGVDEDSPDAKDVMELLDLWWTKVKASHPRVAHGLNSTRAAKVRSTLKRRRKIAVDHGQPAEEGMRMCHKAIIGITFDDWAMGRNPKSGGKSFNDIAEHILNTDGDVEKFAALFDEWCSQITMEPLKPEVRTAIKQTEAKVLRLAHDKRQHWDRVEREDPAEAVLAALTRGGWEWRCHPSTVDSWRAQCPHHQGEHMNLAIFWDSKNPDKLGLKCHSHGCEPPEIMAALDLPLYQMYRRPKEAAA